MKNSRRPFYLVIGISALALWSFIAQATSAAIMGALLWGTPLPRS
jgi:hypothetical protein